MSKIIAFAMVALSSLLFVAGNAESGCRSRGGWGWSQAPTYSYSAPSYSAPYQSTPGPSATAAGSSTYRSYSYDPGAAQPNYQYYAPRRYSAPSSSNEFRADRKIRGLVN